MTPIAPMQRGDGDIALLWGFCVRFRVNTAQPLRVNLGRISVSLYGCILLAITHGHLFVIFSCVERDLV